MSSEIDYTRLKEYYETFITVLSAIDDVVIIVTPDRLVEYMNSVAMNIFTHTKMSSEAVSFIEMVRDYECDSLLRKCQETGLMQSSIIRIGRGNRVLDVKVVPDNRGQRYIVVMKDMTERQRLEDIRRDLISNISHEFRTPIASIKLLAETLIDGAVRDASKAEEFIKKIAVEADKLAHMTDDLRELATVEKSGQILCRNAVDMGSLIVQVAERLDAKARAAGLTIYTDVQEGLPELVIDGPRIESVLMNLVNNAIKFTDPGGKITLKILQKDNTLVVSVMDTGRGIAREDIPRIFERFYKVDKSRTGEGSGLGLSISKHIIELHRGRLWVESEVGRGSTFYFVLPMEV